VVSRDTNHVFQDGDCNKGDPRAPIVSVQQRGYRFYPLIWIRGAHGKRKQVWGDGYDSEEAAKRAERRLLAKKDRKRACLA
jgi:hypothetical protein